MNSINKLLEYHELLMTYDDTSTFQKYDLPNGFRFEFYKDDSEIFDWVNIHIKTGEFTDYEHAIKVFHEFHDKFINQLNKRLIFIVNDKNEKVGTGTISLLTEAEFGYNAVVDWVAIDKKYQGKHLARPLISRLIQLANELGHKHILLHTQTHTWLAAKLYLDAGFEPFNIKGNYKGWQILKTLTDHPKLFNVEKIEENKMYFKDAILIHNKLEETFESDFEYCIWHTKGRHEVEVLHRGILYKYSYDINGEIVLLTPIKEKGILLPIFSLPSDYGIGDFGPSAYEFIDILSENKIDYWNILPIYDTNDNSFYSPNSFYALFTLYISLDDLYEKGLIGKPLKYKTEKRINYEKVYEYKNKYFEEAFSNFKEDEKFKKFSENKNLRDYAEFKCYIKKYKNIDDIVLEENIDIKYYLFLQYILHEEWYKLKEYANKKGVKILGDMPIYPDYNSAEVFKNRDMYQLKDGFKYVSGASPDYFNSEGQKWGHPLYDFEHMQKDKYNYLINRYLDANKKFDVVRIDHFRAFDTYFKISVDKSPKFGAYEKGPSYSFFDELFKFTSNDKFIVEDLGDELEKTIELRDHYNLMGMKVLQYFLDGHKCFENMNGNTLVYTGNHDNDTIVGWYKKSKHKKKLRKFLKDNNCYERKIHYGFIKYALKCNGKLVVIPVQDLLGLDSKSRINIPGTCGNFNWSWKLKNFKGIDKNIKRVFK